MTKLAKQDDQQLEKREDTQQARMERYIKDPVLAKKLASVATPHMNPERLTRLFLAASATDDRFVKCTPQSVALALLECSQVGLEPNTQAQHCFLIPYWDGQDQCMKLRYQPGYKGLLTQAFRSGEIDHIQADVFYQCELDSGSFVASKYPAYIKHDFTIFERKDEDIAGAYCVIKLKGSDQLHIEIMTRQQLDKILDAVKKKNKGKMGPAYREHLGRMFRKAPISRLCTGGTVPLQDELMIMAASADIKASLADAAGIAPGGQLTRAQAQMDKMLAQVDGPSLPVTVETSAEVVDSAPLDPQTPATAPNSAHQGNGKPIPCKVTDLPYLESLIELYKIKPAEVWMIGEDELGFAPDPDVWTAEEMTEAWAVVCERHQ